MRSPRFHRRAFACLLLVLCSASLAAAPQAVGATACGHETRYRLQLTITATGLTCAHAKAVANSFENLAIYRSELYEEATESEYSKFGSPFALKTPSGRYNCRFRPNGLAGSEHTVRCARGRATVVWSTIHL
jgi:hypothetical protein